jgi:hypothetical protein
MRKETLILVLVPFPLGNEQGLLFLKLWDTLARKPSSIPVFTCTLRIGLSLVELVESLFYSFST